MATTKSRINISLPDDVRKTLEGLAKRDQIPTATKAERLLELALELEEDTYLNQIASQRDTEDAKYIPLEEAFK
jgi:hypothetical protein